MKPFRNIWSRVHSLWRRPAVKREIDEELRFHIERRTAENIAAGMTPEAAAREARKRFGNLQSVREDCRKTRGASFGEATLQDIRYGVRMLAKTPGFTVLAVLSLAVGIGLNSTIFSALNAAFLRPMMFKDPDTVMRVDTPMFTYPHYRELNEQCRSLTGVVAVSGHAGMLRVSDGSKMIPAEVVSPNYFSVLGVGAALGNVFSERDPRLKNEAVVVISYRLWQNQFGGDPDIVGKVIPLDFGRGKVTVLGAAQKDYYGVNHMLKSDLWFPVPPNMEGNRDVEEFTILGRRSPTSSEAEVQAELDTMVSRLGLKDPKTGKPPRVVVWSDTRDAMDHGGGLVIFVMPIVGLVLLVACANVSSMLLARNEERRREMAMRLALGAGRWRLTRQLLVESLLLATLAGVCGLLLTAWANRALLALVPANLLQFAPVPRVDRRVMALTVLLTLLATMISGLTPAWRAARTDLATILKGEAALGASGWGRLRGRNVLVVGQLVVSVVFLVTAGLFVRAFLRGNAADLGFERKEMLQVMIPGMPGQESRRLLDQIRAIPRVRQVSLAMGVPLALSGGGAAEKIFLPGDEAAGNTDGRKIGFNIVERNYFSMMGIRLLRGRSFAEHDFGPSPRVAVISDAMARHYWPQEDPIGQPIRVGNAQAPPVEIVGIARDVVRNSIGEKAEPFIYLPLSQRGVGEMTLLVETEGDSAAVLVSIRRELRAIKEDLEPYSVDTQRQVIRFALLPQWAAAWLFGVLGLLAFAMSVAGLYGVVSYSVARRTHEIGVRMALGAQPGDTMKMILRQGLVLSLIGLAIGLPAAFGLGWMLRSALYGLDPVDPAVFAGSSVLVVAVVLVAGFFPARRAAKINPMEALRCE